MDTEAVDDYMGYQKCGVDPNGFAGGRCICTINGCQRRDQAGTAKCDACRNRYLTQEVKPTRLST